MHPGSVQEAGLLLQRGVALILERRNDLDSTTTAEEAVQRALEIGRQEDDEVIVMRALCYLSALSTMPNSTIPIDSRSPRADEVLGMAVQATEIARRLGDYTIESLARHSAMFRLQARGDIEPAREHAIALAALGIRVRDLSGMGFALRHFMGSGDWERCRTLLVEMAEIYPGSIITLESWVTLEYDSGNRDGAEALLRRMIEAAEAIDPDSPGELADAALRVARVELQTHIVQDLDVATACAEAALSHPKASTSAREEAHKALGMIAALRDDRDGATVHYAIVAANRGNWIGGSSAAIVHTALAAGRFDDAIQLWDGLYQWHRRQNIESFVAEDCLEYAGARLTRDEPGDRDRARGLIDEGLAITRKLGMPLVEHRLEECRERLDPGKETISFPDGLTEREAEVLRLIARGGTNKEIGDELFIATKTVASHIRNIYEKTGVSNRAEATAYAIRNGLAEEPPSAS